MLATDDKRDTLFPLNVKLMKTMVILFIALLLDCASLSAQQYRGKVCDAESGQPLVGATVQLFSRRNVFISGALTDADGHFSVQAKGDSVARVTVTYIGYTRFTRQEAGKLPTELGTVMLRAGQTLADVNVTGHMKKQSLDTDQYLVTDSLRRGTMTAAQLLAKLPGVRRDWITDELQINGETDIVLLVNDVEKPQSYIREMTPKRIAYIDVTYRPGGKYAGHAVLVNLRLKDDYVGWDFTPQTRDVYFFNNKNGGFITFSAPFTYSVNRWNFFVSPGYRNEHRKNASGIETEYGDAYKKKSLGSVDLAHPNDLFYFYNPFVSAGADYRIAKGHTLSLQVEGDWTPVKHRTIYDLERTDSGVTDRASQMTLDNYRTNEYNVGLFYSGQVRKLSLRSELSYNNYTVSEDRLYSETGLADNVNLTHGRKHYVRYFVSANFPFAKRWNFYIDYSLMWRKYINTDRTTNENIYTSINNRNRIGAMLSYQPVDNFSLRVGMGWNNVADRNSLGPVNHTTWEPGGWLFWKPFNILTLRVNYTCQTTYPNLDQLSTNQYRIDRWLVHQGNPFLKQTVQHQIYSTLSLDKWFTLYQRTLLTRDGIYSIYSKGDDGVFTESNFNANMYRFVFGISGQYQLLKNLTLNEDVNYFMEKLRNNAYGCDVSGHGFFVRSELNYLLQKPKLNLRAMYIYIYNKDAVFQGERLWGLHTVMFTAAHTFCKGRLPVALNLALPIDNMNAKRHTASLTEGYSTKRFYTDVNNTGMGIMLVVKYNLSKGKETRKSYNSFNNDTEKVIPN